MNELNLHICPTLKKLVVDLAKSRETANRHLANLQHYQKKVEELKVELEIERSKNEYRKLST